MDEVFSWLFLAICFGLPMLIPALAYVNAKRTKDEETPIIEAAPPP